jgi:hypothetical protein
MGYRHAISGHRQADDCVSVMLAMFALFPVLLLPPQC